MTERDLVLQRTDLAALASSLDLDVRRIGGGRHVASCCFHVEKTASLVLYSDHLHCFGCGKHGTALDLVMHLHGVGYREALRWLAAHVGIDLPASQAYRAPVRVPTQNERALDERQRIFDELRALWGAREALTHEVAGSPALEADAFAHELPELAAREEQLCRRFAEMAVAASGRGE